MQHVGRPIYDREPVFNVALPPLSIVHWALRDHSSPPDCGLSGSVSIAFNVGLFAPRELRSSWNWNDLGNALRLWSWALCMIDGDYLPHA